MGTDRTVLPESLDDRLDQFGHALNDIQMEAVLATSGFEHNYTDVLARVTGKKGTREDEFIFLNTRLIANDIGAGQASSDVILLSRLSGVDDAVIAYVRDCYNAQLRWLLVNAYEAYEDFVEDLYAFVGCLDSSLWKKKHHELLANCPTSAPEFECRRGVVRRQIANHGIEPLLNRFRQILRPFEEHEGFDHKGLSLRDWIRIIAEFRHRIVHCRGKVEEPAFWDELASRLGHSTREPGGGQADWMSNLSAFIDYVEGERGIWLLDRKLLKNGSFSSLWLNLQDLIQIIAEHGCLVYRDILRHFRREPIWIREAEFRLIPGSRTERSGPR